MVFKVGANTVINSSTVLKVSSGTSRPGSPVAGMLFFNTSTNVLECYSGSVWLTRATNASVSSRSWGTGRNSSGELGLNDTTSRLSPVENVAGFDWRDISFKSSHAAGIRENGDLYMWGINSVGQLGDGTVTGRSSPTLTLGGFKWKQVSPGRFHTLGLKPDGTAWGWGSNSDGKTGTLSSSSSPISVVGNLIWKKVDAGHLSSAGITTDGIAWTWGNNFSGPLGDGTTTDRSSPVSMLGGFSDWIDISAGEYLTVGLRSNGTLWATGSNRYGQLGDGTTSNRSSPVSVLGGFTDWVQAVAGSESVVAIRANGTAWAWGDNSAGVLGVGDTLPRSSPTSVVGGFTDWISISTNVQAFAFRGHSTGIRANGTAWGWGSNSFGDIGDNTTSSRSSPVSVVGGFTSWIKLQAGLYSTIGLKM